MSRIKPALLLPILLAVLVPILGYYATHKPFDAESGLGLFKALWQIFVPLMLVSIAGGLGKRLIGDRDSGAAILIVDAALGLGVMSALFAALGLTVGINTISLAGLPILLLAASTKQTLAWIQGWISLDLSASSVIQKSWKFFIGVILFCALITALAPPFHYDAITYHFSLPKIYLQTGALTYTPDIMYGGMPQATEMLYLPAVRFAGFESAAVFGWLIGALTLIGLFAFARDRFSPAAGWMSAVALLAGMTFAESPAWGYNDWSAMLYGLTCLIVLDRWNVSRSRRDLLPAASLAGMALATKYTGGIVLLGGLAGILIHARRERSPTAMRDMALFGIAASIPLLPWALKNILQTGNPFYPLLFPAGAMDATRVAFYQGGAVFGTWLDMLILPWQATVLGVEGGLGYSASIGPLLLGFSLIALFRLRALTEEQSRLARAVLAILIVTWAAWAVGSRVSALLIQSRLFFPVFPAWAILAGIGFHVIEKETIASARLGVIAGMLATLALGFTTYEAARSFVTRGAAEVVIGASSPDEYLARNLGSFAPAMQSIRDLPEGERVLMMWEARNLYCLPTCEPDEIIDRWYHDRKVHGDAASILNAWRAEGYTHLLYFKLGSDNRRAESKRFTQDDWDELDALLSRLTVVQNFNNTYILYSLEGR